MDLILQDGWLPVAFVALMGVAMLAYVVLDGYDLGVGILMRAAETAQQDRMVASIGPFWDANETWLVLGVGLLLVAFPLAHGLILTALYLPVAVMLLGLILRGAAFDFRVKVRPERKRRWEAAFQAGSLLASLAQGWMLGSYILGFRTDPAALAFAALVAVCVAVGYALLGACWLILKTDGALQRRAVGWARASLWGAALGIAAVSLATPLVSERIFAKWFSLPNALLLAPLPLATAALFVWLELLLRRLPLPGDRLCWAPFAGAVGIVTLGFLGLAYSFWPYVVPERLTIWQAASASDSLWIILIGALVVLPAIVAYTAFSYRVFRGKAPDSAYH